MNPPIRIGPIPPTERSQIESIVRATRVFSDEEVGVALEVVDEAWARPTDDDPYELRGAYQDERLVGFACFGATPSTDRTFDLYWIAVHPEAQRAGVGAALMDHVERELQSRAARMVVVETSSRHEYASTRRFYQTRGYQEAARLRDFYAPEDDRVVLTRRVAAPTTARVTL